MLSFPQAAVPAHQSSAQQGSPALPQAAQTPSVPPTQMVPAAEQ
jgi:hypothetical protein